jgi:hypothetical protein
MCLLAKKHRNPDEQSLWDALLKEDLRVTLQQGWHDDYARHAEIAGGVNAGQGDASEDAREEAMGKCGIYLIVLANDSV